MTISVTFIPGTLTLIVNGNKSGYRVQTEEQAHTWLAQHNYRVVRLSGRDGVSGTYVRP